MTQPLSSPWSELRPSYDAIVVGSGYGGGIAAVRLAEAGLRVAVLERGAERAIEDLPDSLAGALAVTRVHGRAGGQRVDVGARSPLFELHVGDELSVLTGSGLGGTSLINASVFWAPDPRFWEDPLVPRALREDREGALAGFERARAFLAPEVWPSKRRVARLSALLGGSGGEVREAPLLVRIGARRTTDDGVDERSCTGCGSCVTGCRVGAKRTVDRSYLARARRLGVSFFTEVDVRHVARAGGRWAVSFRPVVPRIDETAPDPFVLADTVVLAAGVFGSTAVLHRSRARGLAVSEALGSQVSSNGNTPVFAHDTGARGDAQARDEEGPGPCITSAVDLRGARFDDGITIEDGVFPKALAALVTASSLRETQRAPRGGAFVGRLASRLRDTVAAVAEHVVDAPRDVQLLLVQGHDDAGGSLRFDAETDDVSLSFPRLRERARVDRIGPLLERAQGPGGARFEVLELPAALGGSLSVHPLGGCPMGDDVEIGVVDHLGRVFDPEGDAATSVHGGLLVLDASILPRSVGTNPVGTLCAVVERACAHLFPARAARSERPPSRSRARGTPATFSEAFRGWLSSPLGERRPSASPFPEPLAVPAELALVVTVDDVDRFLRDPQRTASAVGTLTSPALGPEPLAVVGGAIALFADDPVDRDVYFEHYEATLVDRSGKELTLSAMKRFSDGGLVHVYGDGTSLPIRVRGDGVDVSGVLQMPTSSLLATIAKTRIHGAKGARDVAQASLQFHAYFARRWLERVRWAR